jgi:transposase-like protein
MQNSSHVRKHSTPAQREKILQAYGRSQLPQKEFAAHAGIGVSTLAAWLRKAAVKKEGGFSFVAMPNLLSAAPVAPAYRLQWPGGLSLEVRSGFSAQELGALLQLLPTP